MIALVNALLVGVPVASPAAEGGTVALIDQTDWVTPGNPFNLSLAVDTTQPASALDVVVSVFSALPNRSQFQQSVKDQPTGSSLILERRSLSEVLTHPNQADFSLPVTDPTQRRYYLRESGVYPVRVELRDSDSNAVIDHFVTHLINVGAAPSDASRLKVASVLPAESPLPQDSNDPLNATDGGSSFAVLGASLAANPALPVSVVPDPSSIERVQKAGLPAIANFGILKNSLQTRSWIRSTWTPLPASMFGTDYSPELDRQFIRGDDVTRVLGTTGDRADWVAVDPIDTGALANLHGRGVGRVVVPEANLTPVQRSTTLARPFTVSEGKGKPAIPALQADAGLSDHFVDPVGGALAAHRLLADLAVIWDDAPAQQRVVVAMAPRGWKPDPTFLNTFTRGLQTSPLVGPVSLDQAFAVPSEATGKTTLLRTLAAAPKSQSGAISGTRLSEARKRLNGFSSIVDAQNSTLDDLDRRLLMSESLTLATKQRSGSLDATNATLDKIFKSIKLPAERSIRLTARQGEIPISVQNDSGFPIRVAVQLTSDKLKFPQGNSRVVDVERKNLTERFAVDARTSGAFAVQARIESPDGSIVLGRSRVTIRSTATSGVGVVLSVGAGAFLVIWWIRSVIKDRRKARLLGLEANRATP